MDVTINFDSNKTVKHTDQIDDIKITMLKGEKGDTGPGDTWGYIEGHIEDQTDLMALINAKADADVSYTQTQVNELIETLSETVDVKLATKAPTNHASSATTYGIGSVSNYGHVKLSDDYTATGTAANGLVPSQKALSDGLSAKKDSADCNGIIKVKSVTGVKRINLTNGQTAKYTLSITDPFGGTGVIIGCWFETATAEDDLQMTICDFNATSNTKYNISFNVTCVNGSYVDISSDDGCVTITVAFAKSGWATRL